MGSEICQRAAGKMQVWAARQRLQLQPVVVVVPQDAAEMVRPLVGVVPFRVEPFLDTGERLCCTGLVWEKLGALHVYPCG